MIRTPASTASSTVVVSSAIAAELADGQIRAEGDSEQQPPDWGGQPSYARTEQVLDRIRHGQVLAGAGQVAFRERAPEFEREQRVAERRVDQAPKQMTREAETEPLVQKLPYPAQAQRTHLEALDARRPDRPLERRRSTGALGEQEADGGRLEPWRRELQHFERRRVEPLHVVDRDQERPAIGQRAQDVEKTERDRPQLGWPTGRLGAQDRDLERSPLRSVQVPELRAVDPVEKIDEPGECQPRRRSVRTRREHPDPAPTRSGDTGLPERSSCRSPARRAGPRPGQSVGTGEELVQPRKLRLSPDRTRSDTCDDGQGRPPKPLIPQPRGH